MEELNHIIRKLYEDYLSKTLTKKRFELLIQGYEDEQEALEFQTQGLKYEFEKLSEKENNINHFLEIVKRYTDFTELTTPMLNELVEKIVVHEKQKLYRLPSTQRIDIFLNFLWNVEFTEVSNSVDKRNTAPVKKRVTKSSYFKPLGEYLERQTQAHIRLTYVEIEGMI